MVFSVFEWNNMSTASVAVDSDAADVANVCVHFSIFALVVHYSCKSCGHGARSAVQNPFPSTADHRAWKFLERCGLFLLTISVAVCTTW